MSIDGPTCRKLQEQPASEQPARDHTRAAAKQLPTAARVSRYGPWSRCSAYGVSEVQDKKQYNVTTDTRARELRRNERRGVVVVDEDYAYKLVLCTEY